MVKTRNRFPRNVGFFGAWETKNKNTAWEKLFNQSKLNQNIKTNILPTLRSIKEALRITEEKNKERE